MTDKKPSKKELEKRQKLLDRDLGMINSLMEIFGFHVVSGDQNENKNNKRTSNGSRKNKKRV